MEYCSDPVCFDYSVPSTSSCLKHFGSEYYPTRPILKSDAAQREQQRLAAKKLYDLHRTELLQFQRVALLKAIDNLTEKAFFEGLSLSRQELKEVTRVVVESNLAGVEENSERFFELLTLKAQRMSLCRDVIILVLSESEHRQACGFTEFERLLIIGSAHICQAYDAYFFSWQREANHPLLLTALESKNPETLKSRENCVHLLSPYTMARARCRGPDRFEFACEPYCIFFESLLDPVLNAFDVCIQSLSTLVDLQTDHRHMLGYLRQYRHSLAEANPDHLESAWELCDRLWMETQDAMQIVHDIEDGYSDPLRVKQCPDFSLRILDETYGKDNDEIKNIQKLICEYYASRQTPLSKAGLAALANTLAGIYYIPFKTGASLVFAYSGQSIPNRLQVKEEKGVKIYFDAIETQARVEQVIAQVPSVFNDGAALLAEHKPNAIEVLVWHVAAHEVGHAIYGISTMEALVPHEVVALLEEPRAELTAMFTLRLLYRTGKLTLPQLQKHVLQFAMDGVRYFSKFTSQPMQPYIIFQMHAYDTYLKYGFFKFEKNAISVDLSKVLDVLDHFSDLFEEILSCCDKQNKEGAKRLEQILEMMRIPSPFVQEVVKLCS